MQCVVNHAVSLKHALPAKAAGNDVNAKMTSAVPRAGMPDVQVAFIDDVERRWCECFVETCADAADPLGIHGSTCRKGLTVTRA